MLIIKSYGMNHTVWFIPLFFHQKGRDHGEEAQVDPQYLNWENYNRDLCWSKWLIIDKLSNVWIWMIFIMTRKMIKKVIGSPYFLKIKAINCCKLEEKAQKVNWNGLKNSLDLILSIRPPHIRTFGGLLLILSDGLSTKSPWIPCWKIFHPGTYFKTEINSKLLI